MTETQDLSVQPLPLLPLPEHFQAQALTAGLTLFEEQINKARGKVHDGARILARVYGSVPFDVENVEELLAADLAGRLLAIITRTLVLELNVARLQGLLEGETASERFEHFFRRLDDPKIAKQLLDEYPVLSEQVSNRLELWAAYSLEFLRHLSEDWQDLCTTFFARDPGELESVQFGAGDTHRRGRSVVIAGFTGGERLVYKPRSMAVDEHFNELLVWLNERGAEPAFRRPKSLGRGQHGWAEFIRREACASTAEVKRFYQRQGALLAVLFALEATDFHCENLIAAGEHPMLIDLEALFHPHLMQGIGDDSPHARLGYSVLKVGLLPLRYWVNGAADGIDISGLGNVGGQLVPNGVSRWEKADTDEMHLVKKAMKMPGSDNRPSFNGSEVNALDYADDVADGFARMYGILLAHRNELLAMVQNFAGDEVRVIARPTHLYLSWLHNSYHPDLLRDPLARQRALDRLTDIDALQFAEKTDLQRGDVPLFTTRPASRDVWTSDGARIENYFTEPGLALVTRRIQRLSVQDLEQQLWIVRASLATLSSTSEGPAHKTLLRLEEEREAGAAELLTEACKIGDRLEELAIGDAEVTWIGLTPRNDRAWTLAPLDADLYDGLPGVILFLAYLAEVTGTERYATLAKSALKTLRLELGRGAVMRTVGGFTGCGGVMYCLANLGVLWRDAELLCEAQRLAELAAPLIESDELLDVTSGVAGLGLQLRSLQEVSGVTIARELARACGRRLLAGAEAMDCGIGWHVEGTPKRALTGFAHGNAGIGYALVEMAAMTRETDFLDAARHAFQYERSVFSQERGNWPDFRENRTQDYMLAWCHGAPGVGLSRLGALRHLPDDELHLEIDAALGTTLHEGLGGSHCMCHGDLGNLDVLLYAAETLHEPRWACKAKNFAGTILDRAKKTGWVCGNPLGVESPGLMTGIAGIGYQLLRLAAPERVPSILALEPPK